VGLNERTPTVETEDQLPGMPPSFELCLEAVGDSVVVSYGGRALAVYESGDQGMRNLAIVSLTRAGVPGVEVAGLFGIRPEHVSRLRRQAAQGGARALLPPRGRPSKLDARALARAYEMSDRGVSGSEIARTLRVSGATISRLLAARPARAVERLAGSEPGEVSDAAEVIGAEATGARASDTTEVTVADVTGGGARIGEGSRRSVYAGAMLLHPFLERVGAGGVFSALDSGSAQRYDSTAVALAAVFAFALGSSSLEGAKHLQLADAGLLVGSERFPHLRTLRPRLAELADRVDPLGVQVALSKAMLDSDREPPSVFFVDEHFVAYTGSRPVAKGWNTRRRHAEPGRNETMIAGGRCALPPGRPRVCAAGCSARSISCGRSAAIGR
jgi:Helix-turn-helix domain